MGTVYILGAGASFFAGFPLGKQLLPFLRSELAANSHRKDSFTDLAKYTLSFIEKVKDAVPGRRVLDNGEPDLEFILSLADRIDENQYDQGTDSSTFIDDLDATINKMDLSVWDLSRVSLGFRMLVAEAFQSKSLDFLNKKFRSKDENLNAISDGWTDLVSPGDVLITFNWDLVNEILLFRANKWSCQGGYGMPGHPNEALGESPVMILKVHGSCNWALRHEQDQSLYIGYKALFFDQMTAEEDPAPVGSSADFGSSLIVPSYLKDPSRVSILRRVWESAGDALRKANNIIVLGYSLPDADLHSQKLFREAIRQNTSLASIGLVLGANSESYERWGALCSDCRKAPARTQLDFESFIATH